MKRALLLSVVVLLACAAGTAQNCTMANSANQVSAVQPSRTLQRYSASLTISLKDGMQVEQQAWRLLPRKKGSPEKLPLSPAQGYVRCIIAVSGDVLRFGCANGFHPANPVQTPPSPSGFIEDTPNTSGTTLQAGTVNTITYDCVRSAAAPHHKPVTKK